ncbi:NAD(P)-binding protein [Ferruginibacter sp. SUN106]|uniref:NAD(P)-binding protein n=1 Tax=Ferruginibacter sp. SUN106 TaxID=2978348 RepID=UPI003D36D1A1
MNRKQFIQTVLGATAITTVAASCNTKKHIVKGAIIGASSNIGHLLRAEKNYTIATTIQKKVVIIGAGISGLSAARHLQANNISDFILLDLEKEAGGNAKSGANEISAFPWGAHYVPIPNNNLTEYIDFLSACGIVKSIGEDKIPQYKEEYLCFDPEERLFINGRWQDGLIPHFGVPDAELAQIDMFLKKMNIYRYTVGTDGKDAFAIPVNESSADEVYIALDQITMKDWLLKNGFTSTYLHNYVNYCTKDDFGTAYHNISAWAGIHYFAARKGKAVNSTYSDVITWPEGNGFLVNKLKALCEPQTKTNCLATKIIMQDDKVVVEYFDVITQQYIAIEAAQCIVATPQFVASRLLHNEARAAVVKNNFSYSPWMVANITTNELKQKEGAPVSWDNVVYDTASLGYIDATHQQLQLYKNKRNLTYYMPLCSADAVTERKQAQGKKHADWTEIIFNDLKRIHEDIETQTEEINVMVWGHAMIQPLPGFISGKARHEMAQSINNKIHFAHTDIAGISIFEEAFYQGLQAAKKVIAAV